MDLALGLDWTATVCGSVLILGIVGLMLANLFSAHAHRSPSSWVLVVAGAVLAGTTLLVLGASILRGHSYRYSSSPLGLAGSLIVIGIALGVGLSIGRGRSPHRERGSGGFSTGTGVPPSGPRIPVAPGAHEALPPRVD